MANEKETGGYGRGYGSYDDYKERIEEARKKAEASKPQTYEQAYQQFYGQPAVQQPSVQQPQVPTARPISSAMPVQKQKQLELPGLGVIPEKPAQTQPAPANDPSLRSMGKQPAKQAMNIAWTRLSDEERAAIIAEANEQAIMQQAAEVNKQYDEKMAAYNQANAAYDEWLKKNQSDEVINAMSANPDAPEWAAFKAEGDRLFQETKKYDDEADALRLQADGLHDQALYITEMRRINELLPKMDAETRRAFDTYADTQVATKDFYQRMAQLGVQEGEARRLAETWKRNKNKEGMENFSGFVKDMTRYTPVIQNLSTIALNLASPITGAVAATTAGLTSGRYRSADPNSFLFAPNVYSDTVRETTDKAIRGDGKNAITSTVADAYNLAMGAADTVARSLAYGRAGSRAVLAMDVYQRTMRDATVNGASAEQAVALGLATAGLEYLTEGQTVENILGVFEEAAENGLEKLAEKGMKGYLWDLAKNAGVSYATELPQELISFWGSAAAEAVILHNESDFNRSVRAYMEQGMDEKNAKAAAWKDLLRAGSVKVALDTAGSVLFQTAFSQAIGTTMSRMAQETAEGAPPDGTPPVAPAKEAVEAAQQAQAEEATQTPTAEQTAQQVMQGLPGQTEQQTVQQQAQETPTAEVEATPPQTQVETQTAEQAQAEPQQQTQELSNAEQGALELAKLAEVENYPGREQKPNQIYVGKDWLTGKDVFRERRPADDMDDIIRRTRKDVLDKVGTVKAINSGRAHFAVSWAVNDGKITPAQGAKLFIDAYDGGKDALRDIVGEFDVLRESAIEKAKKYPEQLADEQGRGQKAEQDAPVANEETAPSGDTMENSIREIYSKNGWNDNPEFDDLDIDGIVDGILTQWDMEPMNDNALHQLLNETAVYDEYGVVTNEGKLAEIVEENLTKYVPALKAEAEERKARFPSFAENQIDNYKRSIAEERAKAKTNRKPTFGALKRFATAKPKSTPAAHGALTVDGKQYISNNGVFAVELNTPIEGITENDSLKVDVLKNFFEKANEGVINGNYTIDPVDISLIVKQIPKNTDAVVIVGNDAYNVRFVDAVLKSIADPVIMLSSDGKRAEQTLLVKGSNGQAVIMPIRITDSNKRNLSYVYRAEAEKAKDELPFNQQGGFGQNTVGGAQSQFEHEVKTSAQETNTYAKTKDEDLQKLSEKAKEKDPTIYQYDAVTEKESLHNAELRTATEEDRAAEYDALLEKDGWTAEDNDTAYAIEKQLMRDGKVDEATKLERRRREEVTKSAQLVQSMAKYSRNADEAYSNGAKALGELTKDNVPKRFWKKQGFDTWKSDLAKRFSEMVDEIDKIDEGNTEAMKDVIRSLARFRNTTAWFGMSKGLTKAAEAGLRNLDYDMAKTVALTQVSNIPGDFVRRSKGEVVKALRFQSMLASLKSPVRNILGNTAMITDAVSDSTVGRLFDYLVSKATGVRSVTNDLSRGKEFVEGGKKAASFGSLCVELGIPMESDDKMLEMGDKKKDAPYSRTFSPKGGMLTRYLSAVEKYYSYAYGVSDLFYEGGHASAVDSSLQALGEKSGLTDAQRFDVAQFAGKRRTFKQDGTLANATKALKQGANKLTDKISPDFGIGDVVLPFSRINANLSQVAADYTGLGVKGAVEIFTLIRDAKRGQTIDPVRQRKAVTDAARGVTGAGLVATFAALALTGALKGADEDDWDRAQMEESTGQVGAQLNIDAALRALSGKSAEWQEGDTTLSLDFLEPFNAQMLLAAVLAEDIKNGEGIKNYPAHAFNSVLEAVLNNPSMELISSLSDMVQKAGSAENAVDFAEAGGEVLGEVASSFIPNFVRQIANTIDPVKRDTTADTATQKAINRIISGIPGLSTTLPAKYGADGEPFARNEPGWLTAVNNFINPATVSQLKDPALTDYLGKLSDRTGNVAIYPDSTAPKTFTFDKTEVKVEGKEKREAYQRTYMETISSVYGSLIEDEDFTGLSDDRQLAVLDYAKQYASAMAKQAVLPEYKPAEWMNGMKDDPVSTVLLHEYEVNQEDQGAKFSADKHEEMVGGGVSDQHAKDIQATVAALMPETNSKTGKPYANVRTVQVLEAVAGMNLTDEEKKAAIYAYANDSVDKYFDTMFDMHIGADKAVEIYRLKMETSGEGQKESFKNAVKRMYGINSKDASELADMFYK